MHGVLLLVGFLLAFQAQPHTGQALARLTSSAMESWI